MAANINGPIVDPRDEKVSVDISISILTANHTYNEFKGAALFC